MGPSYIFKHMSDDCHMTILRSYWHY